MKKQNNQVNKILIVICIILILISELFWWNILPRNSLFDYLTILLSVLFLLFLISKVGFKSVASGILKNNIVGFKFNNIRILLLMGILVSAVIGAVLVFAPEVIQSWMRNK